MPIGLCRRVQARGYPAVATDCVVDRAKRGTVIETASVHVRVVINCLGTRLLGEFVQRRILRRFRRTCGAVKPDSALGVKRPVVRSRIAVAAVKAAGKRARRFVTQRRLQHAQVVIAKRQRTLKANLRQFVGGVAERIVRGRESVFGPTLAAEPAMAPTGRVSQGLQPPHGPNPDGRY